MSDRNRKPWIVKLGGSLMGAGALRQWLACLAEAGPGRAVLVPGGGPFADQVRAAQEALGFDDATAHHLALLAMEQFGRALCALHPRVLRPAETARAIHGHLDRGALPVWLPCAMTLGHADIPESWTVTSDSLALWLAGQLASPRVVLIKSAVPDGDRAGDLVRDGYLDQAFTGFLAKSDTKAYCLGPGQEDRLAAALRDDSPPADPLQS